MKRHLTIFSQVYHLYYKTLTLDIYEKYFITHYEFMSWFPFLVMDICSLLMFPDPRIASFKQSFETIFRLLVPNSTFDTSSKIHTSLKS